MASVTCTVPSLKAVARQLPPVPTANRVESFGMTIERNLGEQPLAGLMAELDLTAHALVKASPEQITHKMISRAVRGRRLTANTKGKVLRAFNAASGRSDTESDLFNY